MILFAVGSPFIIALGLLLAIFWPLTLSVLGYLLAGIGAVLVAISGIEYLSIAVVGLVIGLVSRRIRRFTTKKWTRRNRVLIYAGICISATLLAILLIGALNS